MREEEAPKVDEEGDGTYNVPGLWNRGGMSGRTQTDDASQLIFDVASLPFACWRAGFVYKSYFAMGGGGLGGCVFSRVGGSKALDPPPSYNSERFLGWAPATPSFFGHRSLVWLFAGAPFCCVVVQVAGVQLCQPGYRRDCTAIAENLWTLCCTMLSELVGSPVVKELNCNSKDPWFKPWCCEVFGVSPFGDA